MPTQIDGSRQIMSGSVTGIEVEDDTIESDDVKDGTLMPVDTSSKWHNETTSDPTSSDDSTAGYVVSSRWINTSSDNEFVCVDNTASNAKWIQTTTQSVKYYDATVKAKGSPGVDCDYTSINSALSAGAYTILVRKGLSLDITGTIPSFGGGNTQTIPINGVGNYFSNGDYVVLEGTNTDSNGNRLEGMFQLSSVSTNSCQITRSGSGPAFLGCSASGKIIAVINEQISFASTVTNFIVITGEDNRESIVTNTAGSIIANTTNVKNKRFNNMRFFPHSNQEIWNTSGLEELDFFRCVFWGQYYGSYNYTAPSRYFYLSTGSKNVYIRFCQAAGVTNTPSQSAQFHCYSASNVIFSFNLFERGKSGSAAEAIIRLDSSPNVIINNNNILEVGNVGINIRSSSNKCIINSNILTSIDDVGSVGIDANSTTGSSFNNNYLENWWQAITGDGQNWVCDGNIIAMGSSTSYSGAIQNQANGHRCIISNNHIYGPTTSASYFGLRIYGDNVIVDGNNIANCYNGILIQSGSQKGILDSNISLNNGTNLTNSGTNWTIGDNITA